MSSTDWRSFQMASSCFPKRSLPLWIKSDISVQDIFFFFFSISSLEFSDCFIQALAGTPSYSDSLEYSICKPDVKQETWLISREYTQRSNISFARQWEKYRTEWSKCVCVPWCHFALVNWRGFFEQEKVMTAYTWLSSGVAKRVLLSSGTSCLILIILILC